EPSVVGSSLANKYLIWDFDGTLAYRQGAWSECLRDTILRAMPQHIVSIDQLRLHLQSGFPWHTPDHVHSDVKSAGEWWDRLNPVFERAFFGVGMDIERAQSLAQEIRYMYPDPDQWHLYEDSRRALSLLSAQGWQHILLSNH